MGHGDVGHRDAEHTGVKHRDAEHRDVEHTGVGHGDVDIEEHGDMEHGDADRRAVAEWVAEPSEVPCGGRTDQKLAKTYQVEAACDGPAVDRGVPADCLWFCEASSVEKAGCLYFRDP